MHLDLLHPQLTHLFRQRPVQLAYLFGSQATGYTHTESDVDVGVLLDAALTDDERFTERLACIGALSHLFGTDNVDVVILNEAPPLLAYEVLRHGVLVYCAADEERVEFQVRTLRAYEDTAPLRNLLAQAMGERLKAGTFGKPILPKNCCKEFNAVALQNDVIRQRLQLLEGYVQQLQSYRQRTLEEVLNDIGLAWAIEHGLQLSIQCVIDVCHYLIAELALGVPATSQEAIELLHDAGVFPAVFAQTLIQMARFRNVLVHLYTQVDLRRVYDVLQNHLDAFGQFAHYVLHFLSRQ